MASIDDLSYTYKNTPLSTEHSVTKRLEMANEIKQDQWLHECEVSTAADPAQAESDLHKQLIFCLKNPGHKDFIPANKFNIEHIPDRYRDNDMFSYITAIKNLTVRICGRYTSEDRPETFPGTNDPYPFYNNRGKTCLKTGSGMVFDVMDFTDDHKKREHGKEIQKYCGCPECENSPTAVTRWYKFGLSTAQHVVFDDVEAKHAICQLFYDSDEDQNKIREFKGQAMEHFRHVNYDMCEMFCYIHDLELGKQVEEMVKVYRNMCNRVKDTFKESKIEGPLTVIVSHPHGCSKQITIGEMTHREEREQYSVRYTYTAQPRSM